MQVIKRNGTKQAVCFDKIQTRIRNLAWGLSDTIDILSIAKKVISAVFDGVHTSALDLCAAETAAALGTTHPDYQVLAARLEISNLHKQTEDDFTKVIDALYHHRHHLTNQAIPMIDDKVYQIIQKHGQRLNKVIVYERDYKYDYFGIKTLLRNYLFRINTKVVERPQHLLMRVAIGIHQTDIASAIETYHLMSKKYFTHATPTLFNAATPKPQLSSCFLLTMKGDSIEGIYDTIKQCAVISKHAGGIGLSIHNIRAKGSPVAMPNGAAGGIVPMLRVLNDTARYVDQGGGRRKGSFAIYLEPWHCDIFDFLSLKKNHGKQEARCRDLFYALWVPDLFMERVKNDSYWSLMCPNTCIGLHKVWGKAFNTLYTQYEDKKMYRKRIKARSLWTALIQSQTETGQPFIMYKDSCNKRSNQSHLGTILGGNLCTEIVQYSDENEIAVCNLASIALPMFVDIENNRFDFDKLIYITSVITKNLNKIIDINYYPLEECRTSNTRHRPIGIGVQGLADVFILLRMPFDSDKAKELNKRIFETIYYAAIKTSNELAMKYGPYSTFEGSHASKGNLQFDLWNKVETTYNWKELKERIKLWGLRNSLLTAPMPTASTSQILGNNECFEPYTSNVYIRRTLAGEFVCVNRHLLKDLIELGIWNDALKNKLIANNGSVKFMDEIPSDLKKLYRTNWEIKQREIINMAADRGPFIDQSQSLNIHLDQVNYAKLTSMHFYGWQKGLKTGMYYLRTNAAVDAIKFTISPILQHKVNQKKKEIFVEKNKVIEREVIKREVIKNDDYKEEKVLRKESKDRRNAYHNDDYKEQSNAYQDDRKSVDDDCKNKEDCLMCGS